MDLLKDQYLAYKSQYDSASQLIYYARTYGGPVYRHITSLAQDSLSTHPDLTSVALLLIIFYISFVFLLRAWRLAIGTVMLSLKGFVVTLMGICLLGIYNGIVHNDTSILQMMWSTAYQALLLVGTTARDGVNALLEAKQGR